MRRPLRCEDSLDEKIRGIRRPVEWEDSWDEKTRRMRRPVGWEDPLNKKTRGMRRPVGWGDPRDEKIRGIRNPRIDKNKWDTNYRRNFAISASTKKRRFPVLSRTWYKEKFQSPHEESNIRPSALTWCRRHSYVTIKFHHNWATETPIRLLVK